MLRLFFGLVAALMLAACGAEPVWAPDEDVTRARYSHDGPASITLFTVISNSSDSGAHSALMIDASQRVVFDPAGTWYHPWAPERNDVHFGITPLVEQRYREFHTRVTYRTVVQTLVVPPEVAERALRLALDYGAVPKAHCASSTSDILQQLGFDTVPRSFFPRRVMEGFARLPGVQTEELRSDRPDNNLVLLAQRAREDAAALDARMMVAR
ncbi:MAG: hypothetical protein WCZ72_08410 [Gemmobacter sp.]